MAEVLPWPVIARRIPPEVARGELREDEGNVVELRRIRELLAFAKACRERFGNSRPA